MRPPDQRKAGVETAAPEGEAARLTPARMVAAGGAGDRGPSPVWALWGTLFIHLAIALLVLWLPSQTPERAVVDRRAEPLEVVLVEPKEERPDEFVLTNPEVPTHVPDETVFFSDRDQQAAQEVPSEGGDPAVPDVEGELPEPTQNIVSGQEESAVLAEEYFEEMSAAGGGTRLEAPEARPIPGFEPVAEGEGLEVSVRPELDQSVDPFPVFGVDLGRGEEGREVSELESEVEVEADKEVEAESAAEAESDSVRDGQASPVMPRPRPRLPQVSQGPTGTRVGSAPRVGTVAIDANFSEYGDYLARMIEAITRQWHNLAWESLPSGEVGTVVALTFRIDSSGEIHGLEVLGSTASLIATLICQDAVSSRQPYGNWTSDMKQVLGEEQTVRIRFHYR